MLLTFRRSDDRWHRGEGNFSVSCPSDWHLLDALLSADRRAFYVYLVTPSPGEENNWPLTQAMTPLAVCPDDGDPDRLEMFAVSLFRKASAVVPWQDPCEFEPFDRLTARW